MYRHSPVRSKGIKTKHVVQVCLLIAVCFWLLFQVKRSHDKKNEFDHNISLNTHDETVKFGRKDLQPKLEETNEIHEETQQDEDEQEENKHEEEEIANGDDENEQEQEQEQEQSNVEIDRDEVEVIEEDKESEENENDGQSQTENAQHTNEAREEHYKADDASSAVITHHPGNGTSSENVGLVDNGETETETQGFSESNGGSDQSETENSSDPTHVQEKEAPDDLEETLPEFETEAGNTAAQ